MEISVRAMAVADVSVVRQIERSAGQRFREVGMESVADDEPMAADELVAYAEADRGWVATADDGEAVGYVLVVIVDGDAHVEQVSVRSDFQGFGVGRALLAQARRWAVSNGASGVTLTTFDDVAWNRPFYEHLGFRVMDLKEIGPELRAIRMSEAEHGLDPQSRVCMRLDLSA